MKVTEIRIDVIPPDMHDGRLLACFSLVLDHELIIHSLKLIDGDRGKFIAFPAEKSKDRCPKCRKKNLLDQVFCGWCGLKLPPGRKEAWIAASNTSRPKLFQDMVHPIDNGLRWEIEQACLDAYEQEKNYPGSVLRLLRRHKEAS